MWHVGKTLTVAVGTLVCTQAEALTTDSGSNNPYQGIVDRNVFGLKPTPPPAPPPEPPKPPASKITLTGIITYGGKRALLKAAAPARPGVAGKGGEPGKELSLTLKEGQREE